MYIYIYVYIYIYIKKYTNYARRCNKILKILSLCVSTPLLAAPPLIGIHWLLRTAFETIGILIPLLAIIIGFIPGCGPQILVTTLFINGMIPFSALLGNAISNDGDALFPAIAIAPRAAILSTFYSAIPAFFIAYTLYLFFPLFGQ